MRNLLLGREATLGYDGNFKPERLYAEAWLRYSNGLMS